MPHGIGIVRISGIFGFIVGYLSGYSHTIPAETLITLDGVLLTFFGVLWLIGQPPLSGLIGGFLGGFATGVGVYSFIG